jgi:hypothetical protein
VSDDHDLPADPFEDDSHPYGGMLDQPRVLRFEVCDAPDLAAVFEAVGELSDDECRMVVLELALCAWWERHCGNNAEA